MSGVATALVLAHLLRDLIQRAGSIRVDRPLLTPGYSDKLVFAAVAAALGGAHTLLGEIHPNLGPIPYLMPLLGSGLTLAALASLGSFGHDNNGFTLMSGLSGVAISIAVEDLQTFELLPSSRHNFAMGTHGTIVRFSTRRGLSRSTHLANEAALGAREFAETWKLHANSSGRQQGL